MNILFPVLNRGGQVLGLFLCIFTISAPEKQKCELLFFIHLFPLNPLHLSCLYLVLKNIQYNLSQSSQQLCVCLAVPEVITYDYNDRKIGRNTWVKFILIYRKGLHKCVLF